MDYEVKFELRKRVKQALKEFVESQADVMDNDVRIQTMKDLIIADEGSIKDLITLFEIHISEDENDLKDLVFEVFKKRIEENNR